MNKITFIKIIIFFIIYLLIIFYKNYSIVLHLVFILIGFQPLFKILKGFSKYSLFKLMSIFSIIFYLFIFKEINNLEFWGDEIGVIRFSNLEFNKISNSAMKWHAAAPPLDYLNLAFWGEMVFFIKNYYLEFFLRIPYFFYHSVSAIIFSFTIKKFFSKKTNIETSFLSLISYFLYFFNPLLFIFSLEIRFFSLATLGTSLALYLYVEKKLHKVEFIPLHLMLTLNSVFQFIIMFPFFVKYFLKNKRNRKNIIIISIIYLICGLIIFANINSSLPTSKEISQKLIENALKNFFQINLPEFTNLVFFAFSLIVLIIKKPKKIEWLLILIFYLFSISLAALQKKYFDFYVRHYLFSTPIFIWILIQSTSLFKKRLFFIYSSIILFLFGVSWYKTSLNMIKTETLFSKDTFGAKELALFLKNKEEKIYVIDGNKYLNKDVYDFHVDTIDWYFTTYEINYERIIGENWCNKNKNEGLFVTIKGKPNCENFVNTIKINSSTISF